MTEIFAVIRWWAALFVLGVVATPLLFVLFRKLPDRGYAFVKMAGLLLVSYLFWMLGSLGFLTNSLGSILLCLGLLITLSLWLYRRQQTSSIEQVSFGEWLRRPLCKLVESIKSTHKFTY